MKMIFLNHKRKSEEKKETEKAYQLAIIDSIIKSEVFMLMKTFTDRRVIGKSEEFFDLLSCDF